MAKLTNDEVQKLITNNGSNELLKFTSKDFKDSTTGRLWDITLGSMNTFFVYVEQEVAKETAPIENFTVEQLTEALESTVEQDNDFEWYASNTAINIPRIGTMHIVEDRRDREQPSMYYAIFTIDNRTFKKSGYYDSWEGTTWDGEITEVHKVTRTVDEYESV